MRSFQPHLVLVCLLLAAASVAFANPLPDKPEELNKKEDEIKPVETVKASSELDDIDVSKLPKEHRSGGDDVGIEISDDIFSAPKKPDRPVKPVRPVQPVGPPRGVRRPPQKQQPFRRPPRPARRPRPPIPGYPRRPLPPPPPPPHYPQRPAPPRPRPRPKSLPFGFLPPQKKNRPSLAKKPLGLDKKPIGPKRHPTLTTNLPKKPAAKSPQPRIVVTTTKPVTKKAPTSPASIITTTTKKASSSPRPKRKIPPRREEGQTAEARWNPELRRTGQTRGDYQASRTEPTIWMGWPWTLCALQHSKSLPPGAHPMDSHGQQHL